MGEQGVVTKRRKLARLCVRGTILGSVALALGLYWLSLDRSDRITERHGVLEGVASGPQLAVGAYLDQDWSLVSTSGLEVELLVRRPANTAEPMPLVLLLGGLNTGKDAARLIEADRPVVVAALSYPTRLVKLRSGFGIFSDVAEARRAILDTPAAVLLALDHLVEEDYVDPSRIELVGVSLGAPFAVIAGALDPRIRRVWSIHGGGDPAAMIDKGLEEDIGFGPARWAVAGLAAQLAHTSSIAPERWVGRIAPRPFIMVNAEHDERIPKACVDALFNAAGEPRELIWDPGAHIDVDRDARLRGLTDLVLERIDS